MLVRLNERTLFQCPIRSPNIESGRSVSNKFPARSARAEKMHNQAQKGQDKQNMDYRGYDVKYQKRNDPDDGEDSGKGEETVAHGPPPTGCYHDSLMAVR
jgi:hypothetical protein